MLEYSAKCAVTLSADNRMTGETATKKRTREAQQTDLGGPSTAVSSGDDDLENNLSSDIKGILAALQQVRQKAKSDGQRKNEELVTSLNVELKSLLDEAKAKAEKDRHALIRSAVKACKDCEASLKQESAKYQALYESFSKEKAKHLQAYEELFTRFEELKDKLTMRYEQQKKKEKAALADLQKLCAEKIANVEQLLMKNKKDEKSFHILKKSLGSFFANSDEEPEE